MSILERRAEDIKIIREAAIKVGIKPEVALAIAYVESALNPKAKARTSTASGYFQFISSTWYEMRRYRGARHGITPETSVFDPRANALLGCEFIKKNIEYLKEKVRPEVTVRDVYLAHFAGPVTAKRIMRQLMKDPTAHVSTCFTPAAIRANGSILYGSIGESYTRLTNKVVKAMRLFT